MKGTDGTHAWEVSAITGPRLLEGAEKQETLLEAAFDADLRPERTYAKMETLRIEPVQGRPAYVVQLTPRGGGAPRTSYYDKESGRLVKFVITSVRDMGTVRAESTVEDYRPEGALLLPHKVTLSALGMEQILIFDSLSIAPVPEAVYAMPAEVKALLKPAK